MPLLRTCVAIKSSLTPALVMLTTSSIVTAPGLTCCPSCDFDHRAILGFDFVEALADGAARDGAQSAADKVPARVLPVALPISAPAPAPVAPPKSAPRSAA